MAAPALTKLLTTLEQLGILSGVELGQARALAESATVTAKELLTTCWQKGWLTKHQAQKILSGKASELVLGNYLILEPLGAGNMGQVFKARHQLMHRLVALKLVRQR